MKQVRTEAFDPSGKLKSQLDDMPQIVPPRRGAGEATELQQPERNGSTPVREYARTGSSYKRHPFDFRKDQLAELKRISLQEQLGGGEGSMSAYVREAVDAWLAKRRSG